QALMRKVEGVLDPEIEAKGFEKIRSTVEVDLVDGRKLVEHADERYRGGPDLPFTRDELYEKWSDCASLVLAKEGVDEVFELVDGLEKLADVTTLARALVVGVGLAGMSPASVLDGFPTDLFVTLLGVTLLFSIAEVNGTLARL